jgi:hypothetical protein
MYIGTIVNVHGKANGTLPRQNVFAANEIILPHYFITNENYWQVCWSVESISGLRRAGNWKT